MNEAAASLAALNHRLLQAIDDGPAAGPAELADRAGIVPNNLARKLGSLLEHGLVEKTGEASCDLRLTDAGRKGLAAMATFLGDAAPNAGAGQGERPIPYDLIDVWPENPRTQFDEASIEEMAQSIADKGVLQPIIVRPKPDKNGGERFEVVIGERRRRGAALAVARGWQPADFAIPCQVRELSDDEALEIAGVENLQREDMHWMDEAKWYVRLANRLSGAQIERLVGGQRKKRSIQDYIKIARELPAEDIARTYLDEKHKDYLPYVRARDMVGEKKERPALEMTPKLKLALLELIAAGIGPVRLGETVLTQLHAAPVGGPLGTLSTDRKLVAFGFNAARHVEARIKISEDVAKYLQQIGWYDDADSCLYAARAAVVGELQTGAMARGEFVTPELNPPKAREPQPQITFSDPTPEPASAPASSVPPDGDYDDDQDDEDDWGDVAAPIVQRAPHPDEATLETLTPDQLLILAEIDHKLRTSPFEYRLGPDKPAERVVETQPLGRELNELLRPLMWGGFLSGGAVNGVHFLKPTDRAATAARRADAPVVTTPYKTAFLNPAPSPPAATPTLSDPGLPPMLQIVLIELAHRISAQGIERGPGTWGTEVLAGYYKDQRGMQLVQQHRMIAFMPMGHKTLAAIAKRGLEWLQAHVDMAVTPAGRPVMDDGALMVLQRELGFTPEAGAYATAWLNDPAPEPASAEEADTGIPAPIATCLDPTPAATPSPSGRDEFSRQILAVTAEARAMSRMAGALREAGTALANARTRKLTPGEIDKLQALIESALDAAKPHLNESAA